MARVEDRWLKRDRKTRSAEYGVGMRWRAVWFEPDGRQRKKSFRTKEAAAAFMVDVQAKINAGEYHPLSAGRITLADWAEVWFAAQVHQRDGSRETIRRRMDRNIIPELGHIRLRDLTRVHIQAAVAVWSESLAPSTVKTTYVYLAGMLKAAVMDKHIKTMPTEGVNLPRVERRRVRPLSVATVQQLVNAISPTYCDAVIFAAATGLRPSELFGLTWDRVDLDKGMVTVDQQLLARGADGAPVLGPLKTEASYRSVKIGPATILVLKRQGKQDGGGLVFQNTAGPCYRNTRTMAWQAARELVPAIGAGWHQLRHHHASLLIAAGLSPVAVAHRLGHKDATQTLEVYAHLWDSDEDKMVAVSDGLVTAEQS